MDAAETKQRLRGKVRQRRSLRTSAEIDELSLAATTHLQRLLEELSPRSVAVFLSAATEPGTQDIVAFLSSAGVTVWAPHSRDDGLLEWSEIDQDSPVAKGSFSVPEPLTPVTSRLTDIAPDVVICPAALVDSRGTRLGWGKGFYDRFLAGLPKGTPIVALVFDDEVVDELPREVHDIPVTHIVSPAGTHRVSDPT